jgi:DNA-binding transcriptional ArsR family regulator
MVGEQPWKMGPSIAPIAALAGDPARANMLAALLGGTALTATELADEAGVMPQTASSHLAKLKTGGLIVELKQGRHRYFRLADREVGMMLESIMGVAARTGHLRTCPGPADPAMRKARVCYDHLAGEMGVRMLDALVARRCLSIRDGKFALSRKSQEFAGEFGIVLGDIARSRRPLCIGCLDWSMRREHLAGAFGAALLDRIFALKWAQRDRNGRAVLFDARGEHAFNKMFRLS